LIAGYCFQSGGGISVISLKPYHLVNFSFFVITLFLDRIIDDLKKDVVPESLRKHPTSLHRTRGKIWTRAQSGFWLGREQVWHWET
jgi:hypothetical protein